MTTATLDKKAYKVREEVDMNKFPNGQKYTKRTIYIEGPRGCQAMLSQRANGSWYVIEFGASRMVQPRTREVREVLFQEVA